MKKLISMFMLVVMMTTFLFSTPVLATDEIGIWYEKSGKEAVITVKGIEEDAIFLMGCYQSNKMVSSDVYNIKNHDGKYSSKFTLDDGYIYKFFVWNSKTGIRPLCDALTLTTNTPDGVGTVNSSDLLKAQGRITSAYAISLSADEVNDCGLNEIEVETRSGTMYFDIGYLDINIEDYLGRSVVIHYENILGINYVSGLDLQAGKNQTYKVMLNHTDNSAWYYTSSSISYFANPDDRAATVIDISSSASILLNYKATSDTIDVVLDENKDNIGYITAVCSGSNSIADVVFVNTFDTVVVASLEDNVIYARNTKQTYKLDMSDITKDISIKNNGIDCPLSSICRDNVLSVCMSKDGKFTRVLVSTETVSGNICEIRGAGSTMSYKLDTTDKFYYLSPVYYGIYGNNSTPTIAYTISAVLDSFGFITYIIPDEEPYTSKTPSLAVIQSMGRALDMDGNVVDRYTFACGDAVYAACISYSIDESTTNLDETDTGVLQVGDTFWYTLNDNGEICECMVIFDQSAGALTASAAALTVENDGVAFVYGALTKVGGGLAFAQGFVSRYSYHGEILEMKYANVLDATYAVCDGTWYSYPARVVSVADIKSTSEYSRIYTAVIKISEKGRAEDIVQYIVTDSALTGWTKIDDVINEKLTY